MELVILSELSNSCADAESILYRVIESLIVTILCICWCGLQSFT